MMCLKSNPTERLALLLWIIAIHTFLVGVGLILQIPEVMRFFGFAYCNEHFFPAQGGTFHIVMAIGYAFAALDLEKFNCLIIFAIIVKIVATIFLFTYYFIFEKIWTVLLSGIVDGTMGLLLFYLNKKNNQWILNKKMDRLEILDKFYHYKANDPFSKDDL